MELHMQYIPLEYNNNIKHSGMVLMALRSNGMLLSDFKRNQDAIPPHPTPPQALDRILKYQPKESLSYYELNKLNPSFDDRCS
jgi:hypothetical protein